MGLELIVVRHGRTAGNRERRYRGRWDLGLDETGKSQAHAAAQAIQQRWPNASALYSSPLRRARQTAEPIAALLDLKLQIHDGLQDLDYGTWTGRTQAAMQRADRERYDLWRRAPSQAHFPEGESLLQVQDRVRTMLDELAERHHEQQVILVSHLVVNRVLLCTLLEIDLDLFWRIGQEIAALNRARYQAGDGQILLLNDTCHLAASSSAVGHHRQSQGNRSANGSRTMSQGGHNG